MNELIAGIYGTAGFEKTAGIGGEGLMTLSDLALMITVDSTGEDADLEKVASAHDGVLEELVAFDRAGRAMAHAEFSEMEKAASEGNSAPLETFFADVAPPEEPAEKEALRSAILEELARRNA